MMDARKQICDLLEAANGLIGVLNERTPLADSERILIDSVITRLGSALLVWESLKREERSLRMPANPPPKSLRG